MTSSTVGILNFTVVGMGVRSRTGMGVNRCIVPFVEVMKEDSTLLIQSRSGKRATKRT